MHRITDDCAGICGLSIATKRRLSQRSRILKITRHTIACWFRHWMDDQLGEWTCSTVIYNAMLSSPDKRQSVIGLSRRRAVLVLGLHCEKGYDWNYGDTPWWFGRIIVARRTNEGLSPCDESDIIWTRLFQSTGMTTGIGVPFRWALRSTKLYKADIKRSSAHRYDFISKNGFQLVDLNDVLAMHLPRCLSVE